jgi:hypothetical protein
MRDTQLYRWHWRARMPERRGELYRLICRGDTMNSCLIEFVSDGWRVITSRNALRKA